MDTKEKLIDAADRCLLENGCHATCIKAIAECAGVNHGLVHHYFGSKEQLYIELLKKYFETIKPAPGLALNSEKEIMNYLKERILPSSRMMLEFRSMSCYMPELRREMISMAVELRMSLMNILQIEEDKAFILMGSVLGLGFHSFIEPSMDAEKHLQKVVSLLLIPEFRPVNS